MVSVPSQVAEYKVASAHRLRAKMMNICKVKSPRRELAALKPRSAFTPDSSSSYQSIGLRSVHYRVLAAALLPLGKHTRPQPSALASIEIYCASRYNCISPRSHCPRRSGPGQIIGRLHIETKRPLSSLTLASLLLR